MVLHFAPDFINEDRCFFYGDGDKNLNRNKF